MSLIVTNLVSKVPSLVHAKHELGVLEYTTYSFVLQYISHRFVQYA